MWRRDAANPPLRSLSGALLDRLTHHVHILEMNGDSYRLNQSKRQAPTIPDDLLQPNQPSLIAKRPRAFQPGSSERPA